MSRWYLWTALAAGSVMDRLFKQDGHWDRAYYYSAGAATALFAHWVIRHVRISIRPRGEEGKA